MQPENLGCSIAPSLGKDTDTNVPFLIAEKSQNKSSDSFFMPCANDCTGNLEKECREICTSEENKFLPGSLTKLECTKEYGITSQYCKVISLQLIKINEKKLKNKK